MSPATTATVKKATRARKTSVSSDASPVAKTDSLIKNLKTYEESFVNLLNAINTAKEEFSATQKEISDIKESWIKEQKNHETAIAQNQEQEEVARKRETETYNYEIGLLRKKAEDEFLEKKSKWEKELTERKDEIAKEKQELEMLRKQVLGFDQEKEKAVKEVCDLLKGDLSKEYSQEKILREQEIKADKEIQTLRISNLTLENTRLANEVLMFKKSLEEATAQLKDVAVKVIESSGNKVPTLASQE